MAKYNVHKFTHLRDWFLQRPPADPLASRLLPIEVSDEDISMTEDTPDNPVQSPDHDNSPNDSHSSGDHETTNNPLQSNNPFSDDYAMDNNIPLHDTPFVDPPHPLLSSLLALGAKGNLPSGYIVSFLWVMKQFTWLIPSR